MPETQTPTARDMLAEAVSLLCFIALYGPPVLFVAVPWLLLGLLLSGPFAVVLTLGAALVAATALVAGAALLLAAPYLIGRRLLGSSLVRPATAIELRRVPA